MRRDGGYAVSKTIEQVGVPSWHLLSAGPPTYRLSLLPECKDTPSKHTHTPKKEIPPGILTGSSQCRWRGCCEATDERMSYILSNKTWKNERKRNLRDDVF